MALCGQYSGGCGGAVAQREVFAAQPRTIRQPHAPVARRGAQRADVRTADGFGRRPFPRLGRPDIAGRSGRPPGGGRVVRAEPAARDASAAAARPAADSGLLGVGAYVGLLLSGPDAFDGGAAVLSATHAGLRRSDGRAAADGVARSYCGGGSGGGDAGGAAAPGSAGRHGSCGDGCGTGGAGVAACGTLGSRHRMAAGFGRGGLCAFPIAQQQYADSFGPARAERLGERDAGNGPADGTDDGRGADGAAVPCGAGPKHPCGAGRGRCGCAGRFGGELSDCGCRCPKAWSAANDNER